MRISPAWPALLVCACLSPAFATPPTAASIEPFTRPDNFDEIKISPDGQHLALSVPLGDHTSLVVLDAATLKQVSGFAVQGKTVVDGFWWVNPNRLIVTIAQKEGALDRPIGTGEIFATDADGKNQAILFGYRGQGVESRGNIPPDRAEQANATVISGRPVDPAHMLVAITPWKYKPDEPHYTSIEKLDVNTGHRERLGVVLVPDADMLADRHGRVRFAWGNENDGQQKLYYRADDMAEWILVNDENTSHRRMTPMGFAADDGFAYVQASEPAGPDSVQRFDPATRTFKPVLQDKSASPIGLLYAEGTHRDPIGVIYEDDTTRVTYFDPESPAARRHRSLMAGFPGEFVMPVSATADDGAELLEAFSDRDSGDVYRFDPATKKAEFLIAHAEWLDPAKMASTRAFRFKARDGMEVGGFLTLPPGNDGTKPVPLVVHPHGGPFGVHDDWSFEAERQLIAAHGYAVMEVNFRGSGNRGHDFEVAGYHQWGGTMQDDLTDATRWAIDSRVAAKDRICIYGASYGGYAALMGAAKEPTLYRCAAGYVGVYDLDAMYRVGDIAKSEKAKNILKKTLGTDHLSAVSPVNLADRIKVPVFLAAGGADERAPIEHSRKMEAALRKAGVPVSSLYYPEEGHGFYRPEHIAEFDRELLDFFDRNIGSGAH